MHEDKSSPLSSSSSYRQQWWRVGARLVAVCSLICLHPHLHVLPRISPIFPPPPLASSATSDSWTLRNKRRPVNSDTLIYVKTAKSFWSTGIKTIQSVSACSVVIVCGNLRPLLLLLQTRFLFLFEPTVATTMKLVLNVQQREKCSRKRILFIVRGILLMEKGILSPVFLFICSDEINKL